VVAVLLVGIVASTSLLIRALRRRFASRPA